MLGEITDKLNLQALYRFNGTQNGNTKLMLHGNGPDASTVFVDSSYVGRTVTPAGNAQVDTAQFKYGNASILLDGTGDHLSVADASDWAFGTGAFTIDFWVRLNAKPAGDGSFSIFQQGDTTNGWHVRFYTADGTAMQLFLLNYASSVLNISVQKACNTMNVNTWYHFALVRTGNDFKIFQDGVQIGTTVTDADSMVDSSATLYIGSNGSGNYLNGWLDDVRIVKGEALWTANFTPPTEQANIGYEDYGPNGLDFSVLGFPVTTLAAGKFGFGLPLVAASSQYGRRAAAAANVVTSQTWLGWVKMTSDATGIIAAFDKNTDRGRKVYYDATGNNLQFYVDGAAQTASQAISVGEWLFFAGVYDSVAAVVRLFVNGVENSGAAGGAPNSTTADLTIGCDLTGGSDAATNFLNGVIDEIAIYNRAWTLKEVRKFWAATRGKYI